MKTSKNLIWSILLSWSILSTPLTISKSTYGEIKNVKSLTEKILQWWKDLDKEEKISIYNPVNPWWIETDDWYIYIV